MLAAKTKFLLPCQLLLLVGLAAPSLLCGQTKLKPGFNIFSPEQDVEIGKQSAAEVEKQMPILNDRGLQDYLTRVGQRLAAVTPGEKFPYQFKLVNVSDVNAFALPGGFMYVNRGLIEVARNEGELAGVMAHEISHVALRHGTNQASKASLAQMGIGVLTGGGGTTAQIMGSLGGFGLNSLFLKFSRTAEQQADVMGSQIMAKAGYDPLDMVSMFETLRQESGHDPTAFEKFFSDHPAPADRAERIRQEASMLTSYPRSAPVGNFAQIKSSLQHLPKAKSLAQLQGQAPQPQSGGQGGGTSQGTGGSQPASASIELPSQTFRSYQSRSGLFRVNYPDNWQAVEDKQGFEVTIVPKGGVVQSAEGGQIIYGVIVNWFDPNQAGSRRSNGPFRGQDRLEQYTNSLVENLLQTNSYLQVDSSSLRRDKLDKAVALRLVLTGQSPATGKKEKVTVYTREIARGGLAYALFIAPGDRPEQVAEAYRQMLASLRFQNDWHP